MSESIHVYPLDDTEEHELLSTCKCEPRLEIVNGTMIFIHNSFDGREGVEITNEILNNANSNLQKGKTDN